MSESIDDKDINNLISLLKSKEQFSFYYFQEIELNRHGKYDESKASVMSAILDKSGVELKVPYNIQNTPYEFRYISQKLNLVGMLDEFREISKHDFEKTIRYENRIIDCYISIMNEDNRYRKMNVEVDGVGAWLFVLLFRSYPHLLFILPGD